MTERLSELLSNLFAFDVTADLLGRESQSLLPRSGEIAGDLQKRDHLHIRR